MMLLRMSKRSRENVYTIDTEHMRPYPELFSQHMGNISSLPCKFYGHLHKSNCIREIILNY